MVNLRSDNLRLLQELVDSHRMNNDVIRTALSEQQGRQHIFRQLLLPPLEPVLSMIRLFWCPFVYNICILKLKIFFFYNPHSISPDITNTDPALIDWLESLGDLSPNEIQIFICERYTLRDILEFFTREDLRRLGLKGGNELRIWRAILECRAKMSAKSN